MSILHFCFIHFNFKLLVKLANHYLPAINLPQRLAPRRILARLFKFLSKCTKSNIFGVKRRKFKLIGLILLQKHTFLAKATAEA